MRRLFALCLAFILLAGCAPAQARPTAEDIFFAMDTVMTLRLYEGGDEALLDEAEDRVKELEALWSVTDEGSEIYALNRDGAAELSPETADLLATALGMCERTNGALDISIYPVLRAWGFTTGEYSIPTEAELAALLPLVDYAKVEWDGVRAALPEGMEIDLGSVAKGYTGDELSHLMKENGVTSAMLDLGGNIQTVGAKPDGSPWRVGIRDPERDGNLGVVEIIDQAVVTSGGYERYFEENGVRYWHILDPKTGSPARSGLVSVTVVGDCGAVCDALSTALFVMGRERAVDFWLRHGSELGFELVLVEEDGSVTITKGLERQFTLSQKDRALTVAPN
ncbi:MAG: FAD:protein FMN transferase [Oscillospiraceae bacterium]|nr:FAD:protein FMN transferase [Oscillospiraceae bacterium]MDE7170669.1 FAD:protein FMN transferase [Oscillospiraceae bacterium]